MAFSWERDWPLVVAGVAAAGGVAYAIVGGTREEVNVPVQAGPDPGAFAAAVGAATQVELGRQQAYAQTAAAIVGAGVSREVELARSRAQVEIARAQAEAQLAAIRAQAAAQQQMALFGFLGSIFSGLFGLFSVERTAQAQEVRVASLARRRATPNVLYQHDLTGLQSPPLTAVSGIARPALAAA